jgi:dTMP kinase
VAEGGHLLIVLTGIDGSGKSTAANALVSDALAEGQDALLLSNHAGRRSMSVLAARLGVQWPTRLADAIETTFRVVNVLVSHARASRFDGLVVMDRHLFCQLALRKVRGLPRGRLLPWLISVLPAPDAVVQLDVEPELAHQRIVARGTDAETLADLVALRDAYRSLPEYPDFVELDADCPPAEVAARLARIVSAKAGITPSAV